WRASVLRAVAGRPPPRALAHRPGQGGRVGLDLVLVVLGLDLDPDVDLLRRLAVARLEEVEIAHETTGRLHRETLGHFRVADQLLEELDLGDEVRALRDE